MKKPVAYIIAISTFAYFIVYVLLNTMENPRYNLIFSDYKMLLDGFVSTVQISVSTLVLSAVFGFLLFLAERSKSNLLSAFSVVFNEIIMGTPLLVMIFLFVYVICDFLPQMDKIWLGIFSLSTYMSPYLANAYKTAVAVVDDDQYIVMDLYNFSTYERYKYIIIPQIIKPILPSIISNLSSIVKGSALLKIVSIYEISYVITVISSKNWAVIEGYYVMWIMYLIITIPLSQLAKFLTKKVS